MSKRPLRNILLGQRGEGLARRYLERSGYEILGTNVRCGRRELDIVARQSGRLVFIEVKTRVRTAGSVDENPLTARQTKILRDAMREYRAINGLCEECRLDLISILSDQDVSRATLTHYRDV